MSSHRLEMLRRLGSLQLGPPLRVSAEEQEGEVDKEDVDHLNKENAKTPVTIPGTGEYNSSRSGRKILHPQQTNGGTPSSTCPSFWNPGSSSKGCGRKGSISGQNVSKPLLHVVHNDSRPSNSIAVGSLRQQAQSSSCMPHEFKSAINKSSQPVKKGETKKHTVAVSTGTFPPQGSAVCSSELQHSPSKMAAQQAHHQHLSISSKQHHSPLKSVPPQAVPSNNSVQLSNERHTSPPRAEDPHQTDPPPRLPSSKPPIDHSSRRNYRTTPNVKQPVVFVSPEKNDVVVMTSPGGEERRFQKLALVGTGGSSKVYKVLGDDNQVYAIKEVYMKHVDPAIKKAYVNEVKLLTKLRDRPEIVTLYDYTWDKEEGILYLLLEYAEMDLNAVVRNNRWPDPMLSAAYFWKEMVQVVKVIHDEGIIHNDLKPENFVCIGARLKLIDFGIANRIETEKTSIERDVRCGTINYMAPETIERYEDNEFFKVGRPSDVWSLGCILYLLVYGRTPFEHLRNKLHKWQAITDPSVQIQFPDCGNVAVVEVMKKCLRRNPKERASITELLSVSLF